MKTLPPVNYFNNRGQAAFCYTEADNKELRRLAKIGLCLENDCVPARLTDEEIAWLDDTQKWAHSVYWLTLVNNIWKLRKRLGGDKSCERDKPYYGKIPGWIMGVSKLSPSDNAVAEEAYTGVPSPTMMPQMFGGESKPSSKSSTGTLEYDRDKSRMDALSRRIAALEEQHRKQKHKHTSFMSFPCAPE